MVSFLVFFLVVVLLQGRLFFFLFFLGGGGARAYVCLFWVFVVVFLSTINKSNLGLRADFVVVVVVVVFRVDRKLGCRDGGEDQLW